MYQIIEEIGLECSLKIKEMRLSSIDKIFIFDLLWVNLSEQNTFIVTCQTEEK